MCQREDTIPNNPKLGTQKKNKTHETIPEDNEGTRTNLKRLVHSVTGTGTTPGPEPVDCRTPRPGPVANQSPWLLGHILRTARREQRTQPGGLERWKDPQATVDSDVHAPGPVP
jgi:hypothetical protein